MKLKTYLICRIIFTTVFLIVSTYIWFNRRVEIYHNVESKFTNNLIEINDLSKSSDNNQVYHLSIENKENEEQKFKVYLIADVMKNNIKNNYIKYQINDNDIKTLNMDGMIMIDKLNSKEEKNINLKVWVSDTYDGDLSYSGRIVVA